MTGVIKDEKKKKKFKVVYTKSEGSDDDSSKIIENDNPLEFDNLIGDIEDYLKGSIESQNTQNGSLPPVLKFNKNWTLSVTELSSQLWCEKQLELTLLTGRKRVTEEMLKGIERHEELELEDHDIVEVEVGTNEDNLGIRMLNSINLIEQLMSEGKCRELWVFWNLGSYTFCGIIDQLTISKDRSTKEKKVVISDTKTRKSKKPPSVQQVQGASLQVQVYCIMLEDTKKGVVNFEKLYDSFNCDKYAEFTTPELVKEKCLNELEKKYLKAFQKLPKISSEMNLEYEYEGEIFSNSVINLNRDNAVMTVGYLCNFWDGSREADYVGVSC
uniref:Exonuclease V - a 5' deoxyribonuclease/PD-(D/E)XK nuclease superfamily, putative n=1 Tax=Theileria annulata TaxID=5874 RepID=A0A3B0MW68_THEAN